MAEKYPSKRGLGRRKLSEITVTGVLAERRDSRGRRQITLTKRERKEMINQARVEKAVALFLDLEHDRSWAEIAKEMDISIMTLKDISKSQEFMDLYNTHFAELGHDPRLQATQAALTDMLPKAIRELNKLISDPSVPPTTRLQAIKEVIRLNGINEPKTGNSDKQELAEFLKGANITQINVSGAPAEFARDIQAYTEGKFEEITSFEKEIHGGLPSPDVGTEASDEPEP